MWQTIQQFHPSSSNRIAKDGSKPASAYKISGTDGLEDQFDVADLAIELKNDFNTLIRDMLIALAVLAVSVYGINNDNRWVIGVLNFAGAYVSIQNVSA